MSYQKFFKTYTQKLEILILIHCQSDLQPLRRPMPASDTKIEKSHPDLNSFHVDVGIIYIIVPRAVMPTPTHHQVSGLYGSFGLRILFGFLFNGSLPSPEASLMLRLTLLLPVDVAPPVELAVGFRVCVGSI